MKIVIVDENERVYTPGYGVPTIQLGDGLTVISDVSSPDGLHGVCFTEAPTNEGVGFDHTPRLGNISVTEAGAYFQILTNNPNSIDVLISRLEAAKAALLHNTESEIG